MASITCKWCGRSTKLYSDAGVCVRCAAWFDGTLVHEDKKRVRMDEAYKALGLAQGKVWKLARMGGAA